MMRPRPLMMSEMASCWSDLSAVWLVHGSLMRCPSDVKMRTMILWSTLMLMVLPNKACLCGYLMGHLSLWYQNPWRRAHSENDMRRPIGPIHVPCCFAYVSAGAILLGVGFERIFWIGARRRSNHPWNSFPRLCYVRY